MMLLYHNHHHNHLHTIVLILLVIIFQKEVNSFVNIVTNSNTKKINPASSLSRNHIINRIEKGSISPSSCSNKNFYLLSNINLEDQIEGRNRCILRRRVGYIYSRSSRRRQNNEILKLFNKGKGKEEEVDNNKNNSDNTKTLSVINPVLQLLVVLVAYIIHLLVLTQQCLAFPIQLIPNNKGRFQSIGLDSLAGIFSIIGYILYSKKNLNSNTNANTNKNNNKLPWKINKEKTLNSSIRAFTYLLIAYSMTGKFSVLFEDIFYIIAGMGIFPNMTIPIHRSLVVLFGHLSWVTIGSLILRFELKNFFNNTNSIIKTSATTTTTTKNKENNNKWYNCQIRSSNWLFWVIGGYFASSLIFNISDFLNQIILPASYFEVATEGVVSQLVNPENNDKLAGFIGYIAPCISAPWWEEILYRGFMLPALNILLPFNASVIISGLIFSAHHLSTIGFIPLAMLGMTWAYLYAKCGNLFVTIFIHALWNSRVFLGSWMGL